MVIAGILICALIVVTVVFDRVPAGNLGWWTARALLLYFMVFGWSLWVVIQTSFIDENFPLSLPGLG